MNKNVKKLVIIFVGLFLLLSIFAIIKPLFKSSEDKFADKYIGLIAKQDVEASYALTSKSFKDATSKDQWTELSNSMGSIAELPQKKKSEKKEGNIITNEYISKDGDITYTTTLKMTKEGEEIKLAYIAYKPDFNTNSTNDK